MVFDRGAFTEAPGCLLIDDLITAGSTLQDTISTLRAEGRNVTDAIVTVDRQEGGIEKLAELGVQARALITQDDLRHAWMLANDAS